VIAAAPWSWIGWFHICGSAGWRGGGAAPAAREVPRREARKKWRIASFEPLQFFAPPRM